MVYTLDGSGMDQFASKSELIFDFCGGNPKGLLNFQGLSKLPKNVDPS